MTRRHHPADADLQQSEAILVSRIPSAALQRVTSVSPLHLPPLTLQRECKLQQRGPHSSSKCFVGAMASVVSLVVVLALLAMCRTVQKKLEYGAAPGRNLSDADNDQERSNILEECLDFEEEHGLGKASHKTVEDANKGTERLVAMMYESAADFERKRALTSAGLQGEELLRPAKVARLNEPSSSTYHPQMSVEVFESDISGAALGQPVDPLDADAWETTYPELGFDEGKQQQHLPKPTEVSLVEQGPSPFPVSWPSTYEAKANASHVDSVPVEPAISDEDFRCLQAWLEDLMRKGGLQTIEPVSVNTVQTSPVVEEQSAAAANGSPVAASRVFGGESTIGIAHSDKDQGVAVLATQKEPVKALEQPATSVDVDLNISHKSASATALEAIGSRGDERCDPGDIRLHPFVRLPVVKQEDVRRTFRVEYAVSPEFGRPSPMESFMTMRNLFAKASLTAEEVDRLLLEAETLASYALDRLSRHHNKHTAKYIFVKLSSVFMVFDSLICTIEVLGEKMNASKWWPHFVQNFSTEYYFTEVGKTEQLNRLVNRLSSALAIYKTGNRPPLQEVIDLKRTIITEAHKGSQMSHPLWKLWLQDDKEFSCPSCGTESPSDV